MTPHEALKLTKGADGRAPHHSASLRRSYVPQRTFFTNVPSPLDPVFGGRQMSERSTETEKEAAC